MTYSSQNEDESWTVSEGIGCTFAGDFFSLVRGFIPERWVDFVVSGLDMFWRRRKKNAMQWRKSGGETEICRQQV